MSLQKDKYSPEEKDHLLKFHNGNKEAQKVTGQHLMQF